MGYYSPFTDQIFQFFYSLMPLPTIIYWGIAIIVFLSGLVFYLTSTDFGVEDVLSLLPRMVVSVQKRIDKRRVGALILIAVGLGASFTFSDRLIAEAANPPSGGGVSLPANICTNSTINTASCTLPGNSCPSSPASPCWTLVQFGSSSCTISIGGSNCVAIITYPKAYATGAKPNMTAIITSLIPSSQVFSGTMMFYDANTTWNNFPVSDTPLLNTQAYDIYFSGGQAFKGYLNLVCYSGSLGTTPFLSLEMSSSAVTGVPPTTGWTTITSMAVDQTVCQPGLGPQVLASPQFAVVTGFHWVRVTGFGGVGAGDSLSFSRVYMDLYATEQSCNLVFQAAFSNNISGRIQVQCLYPFTSASTVSFRWWAGIPA